MSKQYSQEELNQILLSKPLNEFYLAVIENREDFLSDEEYEKITRRDDNVYTGASKEEIDSLFNYIQEDEKLKEYVPDFMKTVYSLAQVRYIAVLTIINDDVYDIANSEFVDLKRNKIVHYDNFVNYYDETNARIKFFTPDEEPQLKQKTVLVDVDDISIAYTYEQAHINQEESEDLTSSLFAEFKGNSYKLKSKQGS